MSSTEGCHCWEKDGVGGIEGGSDSGGGGCCCLSVWSLKYEKEKKDVEKRKEGTVKKWSSEGRGREYSFNYILTFT